MDTHNPLLGPVIALVAWTLFMLIWTMIVRFRGFKHHDIDISKAPGARGCDLDGKVEPQFQWPAHNYNHLLEQPVLFYAIVLALISMGDRMVLNLSLAWSYVGLRIAHSIWQANINRIPVRLAIFLLASLCLLALTLHAAMRFLHG